MGLIHNSFLAFFLFALPTQAGLHLVALSDSPKGKIESETMILDPLHSRTESRGTIDGKEVSFITILNKSKLYNMDAKNKTYMEVESTLPTDLAKFKKKKDKVGKFSGEAIPKVKVVKSPEKSKAGNWECINYEIFMNDQKMEDRCMIGLKQIGLGAKTVQLWDDYTELQKTLINENMRALYSQTPQGFIGRSVTFSSSGNITTEYKTIEEKSFPAALFELPVGYKRVNIEDSGEATPPAPKNKPAKK